MPRPSSRSARPHRTRRLRLAIVAAALAGATAATPAPGPMLSGADHAEILWDTWGVPHITATSDRALFRAFGWAQMHNQAERLLRAYGEGRGRAAEYWGAGPDQLYLRSDREVRLFGLPQRAQQWYRGLTPGFRADMDAFVAGINDYARAHPDRVPADVRGVLPVTTTDVFAHLLAFLMVYEAGPCLPTDPTTAGTRPGSNGWAIGAADTAGGGGMVLGNPHLVWPTPADRPIPGFPYDPGQFAWMETQLTAPGLHEYGATFVGFPVLSWAFTDVLGWAHTTDSAATCNLYRLTPSGTGYRFDGRTRQFDTHTESLRIRRPDGSLRTETLTVRRSVQGPVVSSGGQLLAIRAIGIDQFPFHGIFQQWWDMAHARDLGQFQQVLARRQLPNLMVLYADRDGHALSLYGSEIPVREPGSWQDWASSRPLPGDTSATLWTTIYPYDRLPAVVDPPTGWVQNSNSPPWWTTYPSPLRPQDFPAAMAPTLPDDGLHLREQRGIDMLRAHTPLSFGQLVDDALSTRMELADRVLPDLLAAVHTYGTPLARQAAAVLAGWDHRADATSRGAVLFYQWKLAMVGTGDPAPIFAHPQTGSAILTTPSGLASPQRAAQALDTAARQVLHGSGRLDVAWGQVYRLRWGRSDLPATGCPGDELGCFHALQFIPDPDGRYRAVAGNTFLFAVRFTPTPRAQVLLPYGNSDDPSTPHYDDQLPLYAHDRLRTAWLTRAEVLAHCESRDLL